MKSMVLLTIGLVLAPVLSEARQVSEQTPGQPEIAGFYECKGMNPDGTPYEGSAEITKVRDTFRVFWTFEDGHVLGVGIWSNGVFAVSYFGGAPAVVVYKVDGNRLVGEWTMGGVEGRNYSEILTKTDKRPSQSPEPPATPSPQPQPGRAI